MVYFLIVKPPGTLKSGLFNKGAALKAGMKVIA
jgi:hypothetical protein